MYKADLKNIDMNISEDRIKIANQTIRPYLGKEHTSDYRVIDEYKQTNEYIAATHSQSKGLGNIEEGVSACSFPTWYLADIPVQHKLDDSIPLLEDEEKVLERQDAQDDVAFITRQLWNTLSPQQIDTSKLPYSSLLRLTSIDSDQDGQIDVLNNSTGQIADCKLLPSRSSLRLLQKLGKRPHKQGSKSSKEFSQHLVDMSEFILRSIEPKKAMESLEKGNLSYRILQKMAQKNDTGEDVVMQAIEEAIQNIKAENSSPAHGKVMQNPLKRLKI